MEYMTTEVWASIAIAAMWVAVSISAVWGPYFVSTSGSGTNRNFMAPWRIFSTIRLRSSLKAQRNRNEYALACMG